eukprot:Plantae.Rhodophyta-Rhodochaete_pulchella.ctg35443.p2 GENE.Plantae.Rhodophyta-Rhodochaete_pulchella.ctg35443~~Plantae.Rhodophyta-Rhodochaete_pulchella.ctg35443.p2  ORF type:complete len:108 (-),score=4.00 Plantae.Rhodophyta-Rhodochaete_pulchella.ctg35443:224-547(-)
MRSSRTYPECWTVKYNRHVHRQSLAIPFFQDYDDSYHTEKPLATDIGIARQLISRKRSEESDSWLQHKTPGMDSKKALAILSCLRQSPRRTGSQCSAADIHPEQEKV